MQALCIGELALDLIRIPEHAGRPSRFESHAGGSPANIAAGLQAAGLSASLISRVGHDPAGRVLLESLAALNISAQCVEEDPSRSTRILFIDQEDPERRVRVQSPDSADLYLSLKQLPASVADACRLLYVSGAVLRGPTSARTVHHVVERVAAAPNALVALDPNIVLGRGASADAVRDSLNRLLPHVDVLQVSAERRTQYWPEWSLDELRRRVPLLILTRGAEGATLYADGQAVTCPPPHVEVVDPTGAGDGFLARLLAAVVVETLFPQGPPLHASQLRRWGEEATRAAARVLGKRGAATAYLRAEVEGTDPRQ